VTPALVPSVVCAGVLVADHISTPIAHAPSAGELVMADELVLNIGGLAANVTVDLARLGVRAIVCGKIGDDIFGRFVSDTLRASGADVRGLAVDFRRATSQTLILNVKGQDRRFVHCFGANAGFTAADLEAALDPIPRIFYLGGYLLLPALESAAVARCLRRVREAGAKIVLDVAVPGPGDYRPRMEPILPLCDVFLPNADEAALILGERDPVVAARTFHEMGARRVVITEGAAGAVCWSDTLKARLGVYPVDYVDGSGSGDAFDAGYIAGLLDGLDEIGCLRLATAIGASCVRAVGTTAGIFTRDEADRFIAAHPLSVTSLDGASP
jgi:sugar/nucleoside kinase (ribokinase family)